MRSIGVNDKMVLYCRRYSDCGFGSYFEYREDKEVCNPGDPFEFYMKIGGIAYLPRKLVPGKRIRASAERLRECKHFGSYVFIGNTDYKIRTLLMARKKCWPQRKLLSPPGLLHSVIPRYAGDKPCVLTGMLVSNLTTESKRRWTKWDERPGDGQKVHGGLFELREDMDLRIDLDIDSTVEKSFGIYVSANTSVLMVDFTRFDLYNDFSRNYVYTLFQEGAFICTDSYLWFCLYDVDESDKYDVKRLIAEKSELFSESPNLQLLDSGLPVDENRIIFLKSAPNHTFWTIRLIRDDDQTQVQICVPTGGQFENILPWDIGIDDVIERQSLKPWNKYIECKHKLIDRKHILSNIDLTKNESYPLVP